MRWRSLVSQRTQTRVLRLAAADARFDRNHWADLAFYLPFCAAIHHVEDPAKDLPELDQVMCSGSNAASVGLTHSSRSDSAHGQATYDALLAASDNADCILQPEDDDAGGILPSRFDRVKTATKKQRKRIRQSIAELDERERATNGIERLPFCTLLLLSRLELAC